jgi:hypothetical protein
MLSHTDDVSLPSPAGWQGGGCCVTDDEEVLQGHRSIPARAWTVMRCVDCDAPQFQQQQQQQQHWQQVLLKLVVSQRQTQRPVLLCQ